MTFMLLDCLNDTCRMNRDDTNEGGYEKSYLREWLNKECIEKFPFAMRMNMIPFENGDLLSIPTEREIFGQNIYGEEEPDTVEQFEPMKKRRNRLASDGLNGGYQYYWLKNKRGVESAATFCMVINDGNADYYSASNSFGVRPLYRLRNYR